MIVVVEKALSCPDYMLFDGMATVKGDRGIFPLRAMGVNGGSCFDERSAPSEHRKSLGKMVQNRI